MSMGCGFGCHQQTEKERQKIYFESVVLSVYQVKSHIKVLNFIRLNTDLMAIDSQLFGQRSSHSSTTEGKSFSDLTQDKIPVDVASASVCHPEGPCTSATTLQGK